MLAVLLSNSATASTLGLPNLPVQRLGEASDFAIAHQVTAHASSPPVVPALRISAGDLRIYSSDLAKIKLKSIEQEIHRSIRTGLHSPLLSYPAWPPGSMEKMQPVFQRILFHKNSHHSVARSAQCKRILRPVGFRPLANISTIVAILSASATIEPAGWPGMESDCDAGFIGRKLLGRRRRAAACPGIQTADDPLQFGKLFDHFCRQVGFATGSEIHSTAKRLKFFESGSMRRIAALNQVSRDRSSFLSVLSQ